MARPWALLPCFQDTHDAQSRSRAARVLARVDGTLPEEVRRAALARLMDSDRSVRRHALQVLGRFPADAEVLTALEEQALLDDANRLEVLRVLADLAPSRAFPLLLDVAHRAAEDRPEDQRLRQMDAFVTVLARREEGMRALLLIARMGERAVSTLPELVGLTSLTACVNAACRALCRQSVITWALGSSEESPTPLQPWQAAQEVRRAILDEVLPWALGIWDPVKDVVRYADTLRAGGGP